MSWFWGNNYKKSGNNNNESKNDTNVSRFADDDAYFGVTSKFISKLPDMDAMGTVPEFYASKGSFGKIEKKTLQDFLRDNNTRNIDGIKQKLSQFFKGSNMKKRMQLIINVEFDKKYLPDLKTFEFVITKFNYNKNKVTTMNIVRNVQLTYPCIVPDQTTLIIADETKTSNDDSKEASNLGNIKKPFPAPDDNVLDILLNKYVKTGKLPKIIIKWNRLVIDLFVPNPRTFKLESKNNGTQMWKTVKNQCNSAPTKESTKKLLHTKAKAKNEYEQHVKHLNDDEKAAIYLYTTEFLYRDFNKICRNKNTIEVEKWKPFGVNIIRALKKLPYYWGNVYRGLRTIPTNLNIESEYCTTNKIVCWDALSSTSTDKKFAVNWAKGNVLFKIKTWHGRWIEPLSHYATEGEVLLLPSTYFKVVKFQKNVNGLKYIFDLEEITRPWSKQAILWVDDKPEGNKKIMEDLERNGIMIIPKTSTKKAIYYLKNELPLILSRDYTNFRIITDMGRVVNGEYIPNGGALFIQMLRQKNYNHLVCIFTMNVENATKQCKELNIDMNSVLVTTKTSEVKSFANKILVCPCSYYKKNKNNNNIIELKKMEVNKLYSGQGMDLTKCNNCFDNCHELVYHCPKDTCKAHKHGYDVCERCAIDVLRGKTELKLQDIPKKYLSQ